MPSVSRTSLLTALQRRDNSASVRPLFSQPQLQCDMDRSVGFRGRQSAATPVIHAKSTTPVKTPCAIDAHQGPAKARGVAFRCRGLPAADVSEAKMSVSLQSLMVDVPVERPKRSRLRHAGIVTLIAVGIVAFLALVLARAEQL